MKGVQCYELFRGIALRRHAFLYLKESTEFKVINLLNNLEKFQDLWWNKYER